MEPMRIGVVGGGPAGLYFALLAKRADPRREVTVVERNPPGATYGWGVVFSEETLSELRDADYETFVAIDTALVRWSAIDIHYRGEPIRARGHGFSAIARKTLLRVLADRAQAAGVDVRFGQEAADPLTAFADHDLVVAADGVSSRTRAALAEHLRPTLTSGASRYVWWGADLALEVFTFVFRPTDHGLFQVHGYPFDARTSTFIVECSEATWRRAGLDRMSEADSLAFCQSLFADHLGAHRLLSNRSLWSSFVTVRNASWHHGNVVLAGDAAHTAHFSIGSGTKLAMEDAIALHKGLLANPGDLAGAFAEYEAERQGAVERFQEAAGDSARYFESVARYLGFEPEPFVFNLLTRSGRITHGNLALRDPVLTNRVDRWFAGAPGAIVVPPPYLVPLQLRGLEVPNRIAVTGDHASGAGLVLTGPVSVDAAGRVHPRSPTLADDLDQQRCHRQAEQVHRRGGLLALRLSHAGRRGATRPPDRGVDRPLRDPWPLAAPSAIPYSPRHPVPVALAEPALGRVRGAFAASAARAAEAGVDLLLLDASDGYLLASFLSPLSNRRDDRYGGSLDGRMRFPLEVLAAVRMAWPEHRPVGVRLVCDDRLAGGLTPDDAVAIARALRDAGCDLVEVASGWTVASDAAAADYRRGYQVALADRIRNEAALPVLVGGAITTLDHAATVLAAGRADLCALDVRGYAR